MPSFLSGAIFPNALKVVLALAIVMSVALSGCRVPIGDPGTYVVADNRLDEAVTIGFERERKEPLKQDVAARSVVKIPYMIIWGDALMRVETAHAGRLVLERRLTKEELKASAEITIVIQ